MSILEASILFTRANNVRAQLDYISAHESVTGPDLLHYNNLIRVIDKIYNSSNTREHRDDLKYFVQFNGDEIYKKFTELSNTNFRADEFDDRDSIDI